MSETVMLSQLLPDVLPVLDRSLTDVTQDSRRVTPGCLFLARAGLQSHGMAFLNQVREGGAAAVLAEPDAQWPETQIQVLSSDEMPILPMVDLGRKSSAIAGAFFGSPSAALRVIGITGTNGKTSCAYAMACALEGIAETVVIGTLGNGFPAQLEATSHTTPDAVELQRLLAHFRDTGIEAVAMEASSHALDQGRAAAVHFDVAVFTNLSRDHLDYHADMVSYGAAKRILFQSPGLGVAVINGDDPYAPMLVETLSDEVRLVIYGFAPDAVLRDRADRLILGGDLKTTLNGLQLSIATGDEKGLLFAPWLGRFNASNLMAVLAVLLEQGLSLETTLDRLKCLPAVPGRMEALGRPGQPQVVVDYAHTPDALEKVLAALRLHCEGRLICVFGCGGDRDSGKRPLMGRAAEQFADLVLITDDNPRSEEPARITDEILTGMQRPQQVRVEHDRERAIALALAEAGPTDLVAVCGKGHEVGQRIGTEIRPFDDRECVRRVLEAWPSC